MLKRGIRWTTLGIACMPLLGMRGMTWLLAIWIALVVAFRIANPRSFDFKPVLILGGLFFIMLVQILFADVPFDTWKVVERSAALLLIPAAMLGAKLPMGPLNRNRMLDVFCLAAVALGVIVNIRIAVSGLPEIQGDFSHAYRQAFSSVSFIPHPLYAAYFFTLGALFAFRNSLEVSSGRSIRITGTILLLLFALLCASRMPLIALMLSTSFYLYRYLPRSKRWLATSPLFLVILLVSITPSIQDRAEQVWTTELRIPEGGAHNSVNIRTGIGYCTLDLLEENWLLGMGIGKSKAALAKCTNELNPIAYDESSIDTHSQPLHYLLELGVFGLLGFILLVGYSLRCAWRAKDLLHVSFLILMLSCMLTENVLSRQYGLILFVFWNSYFLRSSIPEQTCVTPEY